MGYRFETIVRSVGDIVDAAAAASILFYPAWYRGHGTASWTLLPLVYRDFPDPQHEHLLAQMFRARASPVMKRPPRLDESHEWLYVMQHYGLPTRLLDWTSSALVAAYFAVWQSRYDDEDGCIWCLSPHAMNKAMGGDAFRFGRGDPNVDLSVSNAFRLANKRTTVAMGHIALNSMHIHDRQMLQQSEFTIHDSREPLNEHSQRESFLARHIIPRDAKKNLRMQLRVVGVTRQSLFPDVQSVAASICDELIDPTHKHFSATLAEALQAAEVAKVADKESDTN